jgi:hypothetical protein
MLTGAEVAVNPVVSDATAVKSVAAGRPGRVGQGVGQVGHGAEQLAVDVKGHLADGVGLRGRLRDQRDAGAAVSAAPLVGEVITTTGGGLETG